MKIFFDGNIFASQKQGGISRVGFELMKNLNQFKDVEKIFYRGLHIDTYPFQKEWFKKYYGVRKPDNFNHRAFNLLDNIGMELAYRLNAPPHRRASSPMIFQSLFYRVPKKPKGPVMVYVYDMIHELFGGGVKSIAFKKRALDKADLIIAISQSTKNDVLKLYPSIRPDKIAVVYLGVSEVFFQKHDVPKEARRPYVLYVGPRNYAYKNFDLLLDIFIEKKYFIDFDLILVGGEEKLPGNETWLRRVVCDDRGLAELYAGATAFVYPSLYEGFGLPPLEAMASGCPVLASNTSSMPEVIAGAGLLFDPKDKKDFTSKLENILQDKQLQAELREKGRERAKQFTWQKTAEAMRQEYLKLEKKDQVN